MPSSDYTTVGGGLKLKGVTGAGIDKKKKKRKKALSSPKRDVEGPSTSTEVAKSAAQKALEDEDVGETDSQALSNSEVVIAGKTEAERRHEEMRRKRLDERLKREGIKTHKERVEELNKYLSNMSEHHDMPRIGPG